MATDLDLNLLPLYRLQGQEMSQFPGLLAMNPPKRAGRARKDDCLLVHLVISGNTPFPSFEYKQIMELVTQVFYQTSGSLTSAIRFTAAELNQFLLKRNLQNTSKGECFNGRLILGALRGTQFLFAQSGQTHVFHITGNQTRHIHDELLATHDLGVSQAASLRFSQIDLHAGDILVFCPSLPAGWEATLLGVKNTSLERLRWRLTGISKDNLNAVLVQVRAGKGNLTILKGTQPAMEKRSPAVPETIPVAMKGAEQAAQVGLPTPAPVPDIQASSSTSVTNPALPTIPTSQVQSTRPANRFAHLLSTREKSASSPSSNGQNVQPQDGTLAIPAGQPIQSAAAPTSPHPLTISTASAGPHRQSGHFVSPRTTSNLPEIKRSSSRHGQAFFGGLVKIIRGVRGGSKRVSKGIRRFSPTILPTSSDESEAAGPSLALIAFVIPVIIVAIAVTVYAHYGRTTQYQQYYDLALGQASQARGMANPTEVRRAWDSTIYYLDLAEKSQKTQDSSSLRQEAQTALDNLDGILRLDFRQAIIDGLNRSVQISHMVATDTDLYLLDAASGGITRAFMTSQGYTVDQSFKCDPGQYGTIMVDALIDLGVLPVSNSYDAHILAMDGKGNLLYCGSSAPVAVSLVPPQLGWRRVSAFSLDSAGKNLYVLDPAGSAVWQYSGSSGEFQDLPTLFFGEQVPQNMNTAIDLAANDADLYMLFQDGHVSSCPLSRYDVAPMRCTDPVTYIDTRPERQSGPKINDAIFTQISFASVPDPSLYLLEPLTRAIYRFSPSTNSLELRGQFRASLEQNNSQFDSPATAMTISPSRYAFFSVGNQVYVATDVP